MNEQLHAVQTSLSLTLANAILNECLAVRQKEGLLPLAVAVLDAGGQLVAFQREDGCGILRYDIAFGKAWAALGMGMSTRLIRDRLANRPVFQGALSAASDGRFIPVPGGVLILNAQSVVIGAVGVSGDASDRDEFCAIHAIQHMGLGCEPSSHQSEWRNAGL
jgi:uncharacterized protein GlcG (DUF336 family)